MILKDISFDQFKRYVIFENLVNKALRDSESKYNVFRLTIFYDKGISGELDTIKDESLKKLMEPLLISDINKPFDLKWWYMTNIKEIDKQNITYRIHRKRLELVHKKYTFRIEFE